MAAALPVEGALDLQAGRAIGKTDGASLAAVRDVAVGPLTVRIRFANDGLAELFGAAFHAAAPTGAPDWTLDVVALASGEPLPLAGFSAAEPEMRLVENHGLYCLWMGRHSPCLYRVDRPARRAICWVADCGAVKAWERSRPFLPALQAMFDDSPWIALHAAALAWSGAAVLFAGAGRAGKTTLSLTGLQTGWRFLGDDYVLVNCDASALAVAPLFATARLRDDMLSRFAGLVSARTGISDDFGERRHELSLRGLGLTARAMPLRRMFFVERSGREQPEIEAIRQSRVLITMAANTFVATPGAREARLRKISRLMSALPPARFDPGTDPVRALAMLKAQQP